HHIGHDKVPMFFWGPLYGPGVERKIRWVASLHNYQFYIFLNDLDPDGCLAAGQLKVRTKIIESTGVDNKKEFFLNWI
ncbi:MAG: hypothetical protein JSW04_04015, partial [Desulfobacterales bacterium]